MNLILGTANFCNDYGKRLEKDECFKILDRAKELGIDTLATAFDYGIEIAVEHGLWNLIHKYEPGKIRFGKRDGLSLDVLDRPIPSDTLLMAPFNPLNYSFRALASQDSFIARSIFCGGKLQRSHPEDVARLVFGFLKSHEVRNAVFGVESIEELELIVKVANES